ncbi:MAG: sigma-54-dependent transcriptional regulator [Planctomycetaceae bacterium]
MAQLLVIDDEPNIAFSVRECLGSPSVRVSAAATAREGVERVQNDPPDVVLLDVRLPDMSGLDAYDRIRQIDPRLPVIVITAFGSTETAIEAMRRGAFEYLLKPVEFRRLRQTVERAIEVSRDSHVPAVVAQEDSEDGAADRIVGQSAAMQEVYKAIGRVAPQDATVLLVGESGTGKELVARAIYHYSRRSRLPFLAINCAALPESLLESELFGHERGAFTGADQRRIGKFEQVNGGTIFLDEIGDMTPATQAKALRLLQQQQFERVGGNNTITTDVRIIAATNQDLTQLVERGRFRQDLYYRLSGFTIHLPPLRDRREDLPLLREHFLRLYNRELDRQVRSFAPEALTALEQHGWPGNVREFENAVKYAMLQSTADVITRECLPLSCRGAGRLSDSPAEVAADFNITELVRELLLNGDGDLYRKITSAVDRAVLPEVLRHVNGHQQQAAEILGISRMTLRSKLRAFGYEPARD